MHSLRKAAEITHFCLGKKEILSSNTTFTLKSCRYRQKMACFHLKSVLNLADRSRFGTQNEQHPLPEVIRYHNEVAGSFDMRHELVPC